jgi:hypothetical protein
MDLGRGTLRSKRMKQTGRWTVILLIVAAFFISGCSRAQRRADAARNWKDIKTFQVFDNSNPILQRETGSFVIAEFFEYEMQKRGYVLCKNGGGCQPDSLIKIDVLRYEGANPVEVHTQMDALTQLSGYRDTKIIGKARVSLDYEFVRSHDNGSLLKRRYDFATVDTSLIHLASRAVSDIVRQIPPSVSQ